MQLIINNLTGSIKTYLSSAVSVPASGSLNITSFAQKFALATDGQLRADLFSNSVQISDSVNTYASNDAIDYLKLLNATSTSLIDSLGNALTSTALSTKQALDVNIAGSSASGVPSLLLNGQMFSASIQAIASTGGSDNALMLLRNPVASTKTLYIQKIYAGSEIININATFKVFANPSLATTVATITNITQPGLSTTVTVTTSTANGATVGATATISGTTNFNGTYTVASVTSSTVYTVTKTANLVTITNTSGTSTISSSLGTALTTPSLKVAASPTTATGLANSLPTITGLGTPLIISATGQNTATLTLVDTNFMSLDPGQNLVVTANPSSNSRSMTVTIIWAEV